MCFLLITNSNSVMWMLQLAFVLVNDFQTFVVTSENNFQSIMH